MELEKKLKWIFDEYGKEVLRDCISGMDNRANHKINMSAYNSLPGDFASGKTFNLIQKWINEESEPTVKPYTSKQIGSLEIDNEYLVDDIQTTYNNSIKRLQLVRVYVVTDKAIQIKLEDESYAWCLKEWEVNVIEKL